MDGGATPVGIRLRRSIPEHDAYTVYLGDHRFAVLATARPSDARRWVACTRWLHALRLFHGRLVVGLGVQWTPTRRPLGGVPPVPDTLQLSVGHRCLVFHLAQADAIPEALRRFLADPRVTFVGSGSAHDRRMLWAHYGLHVACGRDLRALAGMGNASMEEMADEILGYPGVSKCREVAMSAWHAPRLSMDQVLYAAVDAFLAFLLGVELCPGGAAGRQSEPARAAPPAHLRPAPPAPVRPPPPPNVRPPPPAHVRAAPPANRTVVLNCPGGAAGRQPEPTRAAPPAHLRPAPPAHVRPPGPVPIRPAPPATRALVLNNPARPAQRVFVRRMDPILVHPAPPVQHGPFARAPAVNHVIPMTRVECSPRAFCEVPLVTVGTGAASSNSNGVDTSDGLTGSGTDVDTDYDSYEGDTATRRLPVRVCASDSEDEDYSSDGFEHVRFGAFTDEEEDEDDVNVDDQEDEDDVNVGDQEDEEGNTVCTGLGILSVDDNEEEGYMEEGQIGILTVDCNRDDVPEDFTGDGVFADNVEEDVEGGCAFEYLGDSEAVLDDGDDVLGQDDWFEQEDYGCDLDDDDGLEEFYLLSVMKAEDFFMLSTC
ncbi:hypothetical protein EJB05_13700, partial [Eragrostis curvula]